MSKKIIIVFKSMSEPCLKASPLVWLSSFYVHFILPRTKAQSDIFLYKEPLHYDHLVVQTARFIVARCTNQINQTLYQTYLLHLSHS